MNRRVFPLFAAGALVVASSIADVGTVSAHIFSAPTVGAQTAALRRIVVKTAPTKSVKQVRAVKVIKKTAPTPSKTTVAKSTAPASTSLPPSPVTSTTTTMLVQLLATSTVPLVTAPPVVTAPTPASTTTVVGAVQAIAATTTSTKASPTTTSTLPPAPVPAPANPPIRASAAGIDPYRGLGAWVDMLDWSVQFSKKPNPPINWQSMDQLAAAGIQTVYLQGAQWATPGDVLEPERLIPMINRAHELGMYVVIWYLPALQDVNTDLRKTVALANLEVDGINIDIENVTAVTDVNERNRRLVAYSAALRQLLPGRFITNDIVAPSFFDGISNLWPQANGVPKTNLSYWRGPFPYREIAPYYDLWMIQNYWTQRSSDSGWRDGYRYTIENVNRLRNNVGRPDVAIHLIGGVGDAKPTLNDLAGFQQAARETGSIGLSYYDWFSWPKDWWRYSLSFRRPNLDGSFDQRFPVIEPPVYVPSTQPPFTTTTTRPGPVPVVPSSVPTVVVNPA